jgi:hypothetical protein
MNGIDSESTKMSLEIESDSPTLIDRLGFKRFVAPITQRIVHATSENTPLTIGIYGEWGSGKTSFLRMVEEELRKQSISPIWFNAWKYSLEENLWSALIQTILNQTKITGNWYRRARVKFEIWRESLDPSSGFWEIGKGVLLLGFRILLMGVAFLSIFGWTSSEITAFLNQVFFQRFSLNPITLTFFQTSFIRAVIAVITFFASRPDELVKLFNVKLELDISKLKRSKTYRSRIAFLDEFSEEFKRIIKLA